MDIEARNEIEKLGSQVLALETLLFSLLSSLRKSGALDVGSLGQVFVEADEALEAAALQLGAQPPPQYITRAMKIVDEIRANLGFG